MDSDTTTVLRQSPRNSRIISETRIEEITASRITLVTAARTNTDWSKSSLQLHALGRRRLDLGQQVAGGIDHRQGGGVGMLEDGQIGGALAVDMHDIGLDGDRNPARWPTSPSSTGTPFTTPMGMLREFLHRRRGWN